MPSATRATSSAPASTSSATGAARVEPERVDLRAAGPAPTAPGGGTASASVGGIRKLPPVEDHDREREAEGHGREVRDHLEPRDRAAAEQRAEVEVGSHEAADLFARARQPRRLERPGPELKGLTEDSGREHREEVADSGEERREGQQHAGRAEDAQDLPAREDPELPRRGRLAVEREQGDPDRELDRHQARGAERRPEPAAQRVLGASDGAREQELERARGDVLADEAGPEEERVRGAGPKQPEPRTPRDGRHEQREGEEGEHQRDARGAAGALAEERGDQGLIHAGPRRAPSRTDLPAAHAPGAAPRLTSPPPSRAQRTGARAGRLPAWLPPPGRPRRAESRAGAPRRRRPRPCSVPRAPSRRR